MLLDSSSRPESGSMKMAERCRPDYETIITRLNERLDKEKKLRDALLEYFKDRTVEGQVAQLIGEIVTRCGSLIYERDEFMKRQEEDKD